MAGRRDLVSRRYVRKALEEALQEAGMMSNVMFNFKQEDKLNKHERELCRERQEKWDKVKRDLPAWMWKKQKKAGKNG